MNGINSPCDCTNTSSEQKTGKYIIKPVTYTDYNETRKNDGENEKP